jgi:hypothetical protein
VKVRQAIAGVFWNQEAIPPEGAFWNQEAIPPEGAFWNQEAAPLRHKKRNL